MADQELNIIIKAKNDAKAAFDEANKNLDAYKKKSEDTAKTASEGFKKLKIAILAAGAGLVAYAGFAIKSAAESELAMKQVEQSLMNAGISGDDLVKKMEEITAGSRKMGERLGFDDEQIAQGIAKLTQITGEYSQSVKLQTLVADLARAKNIDYATAATLVGQAYMGNGKVFKQFGIDIKDSATPLEAIGILQEKVSGQSDVYAKSLAGLSARAKETFANMTEDIGGKLLPKVLELGIKFMEWLPAAIEKTVETITKLTTFFKEHQEIAIGLATTIATLFIPILISIATTIWTTTIPAFAAMAVAAAPWLIGGAIIGGIVAGVLWVINNWELVKTKAIEIWNAITTYVGGKVEAMGTAIISAMDKFKKVWEEVWTSIKDFAMGIIDPIRDTIIGIIDIIQKAIDKLKEFTGLKDTGFTTSFGGGKSGGKGVTGSFASGGIVTKPTTALIGEGGEPEAIVPLSKAGKFGFGEGGQTININISGGVFSSVDDFVSQVSRRMGKELSFQFKRA